MIFHDFNPQHSSAKENQDKQVRNKNHIAKNLQCTIYEV